eukprot:365025-Chlamydomonas_euryale.AAC.17
MGLGHCTRRVEICCDCPIAHGQRPRDAAGSYRGISLLSVAGKVYADLLLHRTIGQAEKKLRKGQNGSREGEAILMPCLKYDIYTTVILERSSASPVTHGAGRGDINPCNCICGPCQNSISWEARWGSDLKNLHTGTGTVVRVDGEVGHCFPVKRPSHSCPRQAVESLHYYQVRRCTADRCISGVVALLCSGELAFPADLPDHFVVLVGMVGAGDWSMSREMDAHNVHAMAAFCQLQDIWASLKLSNKQKMDMCRTSVFLYVCEM